MNYLSANYNEVGLKTDMKQISLGFFRQAMYGFLKHNLFMLNTHKGNYIILRDLLKFFFAFLHSKEVCAVTKRFYQTYICSDRDKWLLSFLPTMHLQLI